MSEDTATVPKPRAGRAGCLLRAGVAILVAIGIVVAIGTVFNEGDNADQPLRGFVAGKADALPPGSVNYFEQQHVFITHLQSGEFIALYDRSTRQQELNGDCRIHHEDTAGIGTLDPLPGLGGALVEDCNGVRAVWRVDGKFSFGPANGDLDRFDTRIDAEGNLVVATESRSCSHSRGAPGLPPFDPGRCGKPD
ncbi:MAG: hypothetical protein AAB349_01430 [Chloroflexota bacterium]